MNSEGQFLGLISTEPSKVMEIDMHSEFELKEKNPSGTFKTLTVGRDIKKHFQTGQGPDVAFVEDEVQVDPRIDPDLGSNDTTRRW